MGIYVYKVLKKTLPLVNGERAHMAVFAYKDSRENNSILHARSGCSRCDNAAANGERGNWIVHCYRDNDGRVTVSRVAKKAKFPIGSYVEEFNETDECEVSEKLPKNHFFT